MTGIRVRLTQTIHGRLGEPLYEGGEFFIHGPLEKRDPDTLYTLWDLLRNHPLGEAQRHHFEVIRE